VKAGKSFTTTNLALSTTTTLFQGSSEFLFTCARVSFLVSFSLSLASPPYAFSFT
jgi:hypothetical protein